MRCKFLFVREGPFQERSAVVFFKVLSLVFVGFVAASFQEYNGENIIAIAALPAVAVVAFLFLGEA